MKCRVVSEGRPDVWLVEKDDLKAFITSRELEVVHNFKANPLLMLGADHSVAGVMKDIDRADSVALLTGEAKRGNMGHALSMILNNELELFDIGDLTEEDLDPQEVTC